jgi:hypothetical protein
MTGLIVERRRPPFSLVLPTTRGSHVGNTTQFAAKGEWMTKRTAGKKPAFGGYAISFRGRTDSLESLFGATPIGPAEMTKKLWSYVKRKGLANKS